MTGTWAKNQTGAEYFFYRCAAHVRDRSRGPCRSSDRASGVRMYLPAKEIEEFVWVQVDAMLSDPGTLAAAIGAKLAERERMEPIADDSLSRHAARLERSQRAWDAARRLFLAGDVDEATFRRDRTLRRRDRDAPRGDRTDARCR